MFHNYLKYLKYLTCEFLRGKRCVYAERGAFPIFRPLSAFLGFPRHRMFPFLSCAERDTVNVTAPYKVTTGTVFLPSVLPHLQSSRG
jgi:hypothetical protein